LFNPVVIRSEKLPWVGCTTKVLTFGVQALCFSFVLGLFFNFLFRHSELIVLERPPRDSRGVRRVDVSNHDFLRMPGWWKKLVSEMLAVDPKVRPTATQVIEVFEAHGFFRSEKPQPTRAVGNPAGGSLSTNV
jgi:hypothetical protein